MRSMNDTQPVVEIHDDNPTEEQIELAFKRAKNTFGGIHTDYEGEEFTDEFRARLNDILNEEAIQGLIDKGLMEPVVREDGQIGYTPTKDGERALEAMRA